MGRAGVQSEPPGASALTSADAGRVLEAVLDSAGATLHDWQVRSVHRRGTSSVAVVYEVDLTDGRGQRRERLFVGHASTRPVPAGGAELDIDGAAVHVWQFPHDPYLPALPEAVNRASAAALLRRLDLLDDADDAASTTATPAIRTRSYRPTRRAVVELRPTSDTPPAAYLKLLGGRDPARRRRRAQRLVRVHQQLGHAAPVPHVLEHDADGGRVVLGALPGDSLRTALRDGSPLPEPGEVQHLLTTLHAVTTLPDGADPDGYADVARHVDRLRRRLPTRATDLERIATVTAGVSGPRATVHGDLHDGQLLVSDGTVTGLLDVDGAGPGLVAHDCGRLIAHLEASTLTVPAAAERVRTYVADLRPALAELAPARDIAAAAAGAWLGLATGPLRVASPDWEVEVAARIDRALWWATEADRRRVTLPRAGSGPT